MSNKILIAEDEEDIRQLLSIHLENEGYDVYQAADGLEALELFYKEDIDLMLLDVMMPKIDGFKVLTKIRENSDIPVIFLTARSEEEDKIIRAWFRSRWIYVVKPF